MKNASINDKPIELLTKKEHLIKSCKEGDRAAQSALYEFYASEMMLLCLRYAKNREEAEEILQDGFLKIFKFIWQFKNSGSFEGWMRKIFVNSALQKYRDNLHLHPVIFINNYSFDLPDPFEAGDQFEAKELLQMVQKLPPRYRMVFNLYVFEGMKHREIAVHLKISEGTSKSNLSDARAILQKAVHNSLQSSQNINQL